MAKKPKKSGRQNYDWSVIMHDYVTDPKATLRTISEKYDIRPATVAKQSKADNWFATRKEHQKKVIAKAIAKTCELQAKELAEEADFLALIKSHVSHALNDKAQFNRHLKVDPVTGDVSEQILDKIDARAVKDIMQTLKMIEDMSRSLYNIQKAEIIQRHQIEAERLELERKRLELEKEKNALRNGEIGDSSKYGVVIMPEVLTDGE